MNGIGSVAMPHKANKKKTESSFNTCCFNSPFCRGCCCPGGVVGLGYIVGAANSSHAPLLLVFLLVVLAYHVIVSIAWLHP